MARTSMLLPNFASTPVFATQVRVGHQHKRKGHSGERSKSLEHKKSKYQGGLNESYLDHLGGGGMRGPDQRYVGVGDSTLVAGQLRDGENRYLPRYGILPSFQPVTNPSRFTTAYSTGDTDSDIGGADGNSHTLADQLRDDEVLTAGVFRSEMEAYMEKFAQRMFIGIQETVAFDLAKRDEYMHSVVDVLNTHTTDIAELKGLFNNMHIAQNQQTHKSEEESSSTRDNIIIIDGVAEGEKSRGELTDKLVVLLNENFPMLKEFQGRELLNVDRLGRERTGANPRPRSIKVQLYSDWRKSDVIANRNQIKTQGLFIKEYLTREMVNVEYRARLAYKAGQIGKFSTKKDHLLFLTGRGNPSVKVTNMVELANHIEKCKRNPALIQQQGKPPAQPQGIQGGHPHVPMQVDP